MKSFDYMEFNDGYGFVFCAKKYTAEEARKIAAEERGEDIVGISEPEKIYVRYTINGGWEINYQPCYMTCGKDDRGSFLCWRVH